MKIIPPLLLLCMTSCMAHLDREPDIVIDESFTQSELDGIHEGLTLWEKDAPLHFTRRTQPHTEISDTDGEGNTIFIIRGYYGCPMNTVGRDDVSVGVENTKSGKRFALICLNAEKINREINNTPHYWRKVTMHEVGHALGLDHTEEPGVMRTGLHDVADEPSPRDIENLR
jgi:hypothetical protein